MRGTMVVLKNQVENRIFSILKSDDLVEDEWRFVNAIRNACKSRFYQKERQLYFVFPENESGHILSVRQWERELSPRFVMLTLSQVLHFYALYVSQATRARLPLLESWKKLFVSRQMILTRSLGREHFVNPPMIFSADSTFDDVVKQFCSFNEFLERMREAVPLYKLERK